MNPSKRRRLDESSSILSKPFKSPMLQKKPATDDHTAQRTPLSTATATSTNLPFSPPPKISSSPGSLVLSRPTLTTHTSLSSPSRPTPSRPRPSSLLSTSKDSIHLALQKQHSALLLQLSTLRMALDTAEQALKISDSSTDTELNNLITKWRCASREAAEELFRLARDRVNKMGGVGAWRERSQQKSGWGDEDEGEKNEDGTELSSAQKEAREAMMEEMRAEMEKYGEKKEEVVMVEEKDDESFTMDMMLRQLNVELDVIGYDKASQRWV